jgi:DNA polymerase-3 subunit alpha
LIKQTGTHPAGLIFSKNKLDNLLPMQEGQQGTYQSQIELKELENFGFIKIDFLGLRTLSIMSQIINRINLKEQFNLSKISMQDTKTYNLLKSGDTWGIFQLESRGINKVVKRLKPEKFDDLVALIALYRPGPMKNIDEFVLRKNGKSFTHMHSELKSILDETYGIIVYQEQVLRIVQEFANYSLSEADIFRRAISKKDSKLLFEERKKFIDKAVKNNQDFSVAKHIYDIIIKFANYGFNKSHSVSYALLTYQMAFLKANYYNDFILTMLDFSIGDSKTTFDIMKIIKTKNMLIGTPDINLSSKKYMVLNGKIIPPLNIVKSINEELSNFLIENRSNKYVSFHDLKTKIFKKISEKKLKMLIYSGALDSLDLNKKSMVENISLKTIEYSKYVEDFSYSKFPEYTYVELQKFELESYGYNLKYNLKNYLEKYKLRKIADLTLSKKISIACISINKKEIYTKEKKLMAFLELYDGEKKIVAKVFPTIYSKIKDVDIYKYPLKVLLKLEKYKEKIDYIINDISILSSN